MNLKTSLTKKIKRLDIGGSFLVKFSDGVNMDTVIMYLTRLKKQLGVNLKYKTLPDGLLVTRINPKNIINERKHIIDILKSLSGSALVQANDFNNIHTLKRYVYEFNSANKTSIATKQSKCGGVWLKIKS